MDLYTALLVVGGITLALSVLRWNARLSLVFYLVTFVGLMVGSLLIVGGNVNDLPAIISAAETHMLPPLFNWVTVWGIALLLNTAVFAGKYYMPSVSLPTRRREEKPEEDTFKVRVNPLTKLVKDVPSLKPRAAVATADASRVVASPLLDDAYGIVFNGEVYASYVEEFRDACAQAIASPKQTVLITLDSLGGRADSGMLMFAAITQMQQSGKTVKILVNGACQSAALSVLTSVPVQNRFATDGSRFMAHAPRDAFTGAVIRGENAAWVVNTLLSGSTVTEESLMKLLKHGGDYYFDAKTAQELGFIAGVI